MCHAAKHIDECLNAENDFLDSCNALEVLARLHQSASHQHEAMTAESSLANSPPSPAQSRCSVNGAPGVSEVHTKAALETLTTLRFLRTRQCKLQTLHYLNAVIAVQVELLSDEDAELNLFDVESAPNSGLAEPVALRADQTPLVDSLKNTEPNSFDKVAQDLSAGPASACSRIRYVLTEDPVCGVCVRDEDGQRVLHSKAMELFEVFERETMRVATFFLEKWRSAREEDSSSDASDEICIFQV